jgi:hypothetical protein
MSGDAKDRAAQPKLNAHVMRTMRTSAFFHIANGCSGSNAAVAGSDKRLLDLNSRATTGDLHIAAVNIATPQWQVRPRIGPSRRLSSTVR